MDGTFGRGVAVIPTLQDGVSLEWRTSRCRLRDPAATHRRIQGVVERPDPAIRRMRTISHSRHDEEIARARRSDVRQADALRVIARHLEILPIEQIVW